MDLVNTLVNCILEHGKKNLQLIKSIHKAMKNIRKEPK